MSLTDSMPCPFCNAVGDFDEAPSEPVQAFREGSTLMFRCSKVSTHRIQGGPAMLPRAPDALDSPNSLSVSGLLRAGLSSAPVEQPLVRWPGIGRIVKVGHYANVRPEYRGRVALVEHIDGNIAVVNIGGERVRLGITSTVRE